MKTQYNKAFTVFIIMIFSFYSTALFAQPTITAVGGGTPLTCMSANPADANYSITYQVNVPANISVLGMSWAGDIVITAQPATYPVDGGTTGTSFTVTAESRNNGREISNTCDDYLLPTGINHNHLNVDATNWGFAKSRLTVSWKNGICGDYVSLDIFKKFDLHPKIIGPGCLKQGDKITFSVCNILSGHNTPAALGQDKYYWTGDPTNNYDNSFYPTGLNYLYSSADGSSITFRVDDYSFIGTKLYCRFGQSNPTTVSYVDLSAITFQPSISVKDGSGNTINPVQVGTYNYCIDGTTAFSNIQIVCTPPSPPSGYDYTFDLSSNNYGWGFPTAQTLNFKSKVQWSKNASIGLIGGEIYIRTSGTCDTRTDVIKIGRNISSPTYSISGNTNLGGQPLYNCIGSQGGIFTLNPHPGNVPVSWTYPSTWTPANNTATNASAITLFPGVPTLSNAIVSASVGGCNSTVQFPVFLRPGNITQITLNGNPVSSPFCIPRPPTALTFTAVGGTNAVSYTWAYPNTTWQGTQNGSSITLTPNNSNTGNVSVTAVSYSSNCTSNTYGFSTVYAPTPGTITGPTCIAAGNTDALTLGAALTNVTYTVPAVTGATYQWNIPPAMYSGTLPTNPGNSITFTCNGNPSGSPYEISVAVSTSGGCVSTSKISVNVDLRGDVLNSTVGTSSQLLELLKGGVLDNAISGYQWFQWTTGRNNISGNNSNSITLSNAGTAGNYGVEATYNNYGCKNVYAIAGTNYGNKNGQGSKPKMPARQSKAANPT